MFSLVIIDFISAVKAMIQELCKDDTHREETSKQSMCVDKFTISV
jgi:hypothetical protein